MIQEVGGTFNRRVATRIFRDNTGHTIRVTVSGETAAIFPDLPGPNIGVEDLGITGYRPPAQQGVCATPGRSSTC